MYVCMCVYVCIYVRTYVRMYVCIHLCMYVCMHVCMYVCMYVLIYVCMCVCVYEHSLDITIILPAVVLTAASPINNAVSAGYKMHWQLQHFSRPANSGISDIR